MYKLLYPSIRVRTAPPVSVRVRVSVSFSYGVMLLQILFLNLGPSFPDLPKFRLLSFLSRNTLSRKHDVGVLLTWAALG